MAITQYYTATTLDGFIADEHNSLQWLFDVSDDESPESGRLRVGGVLRRGRASSRWARRRGSGWSTTRTSCTTRSAGATSTANGPRWVFSSKQRTVVPDLDVRFVSGDVAPVHAEMTEAAAGSNVWIVGGGDLVGQFHDAGLLDQIIATVAPVTLGAGAPLLPRRIEGMRLRNVNRMGPMVTLTYDVKPPLDELERAVRLGRQHDGDRRRPV